MNPIVVKLSISGLLAVVCITSIVITKGETGIGWFIFGMLCTWGNEFL